MPHCGGLPSKKILNSFLFIIKFVYICTQISNAVKDGYTIVIKPVFE